MKIAVSPMKTHPHNQSKRPAVKKSIAAYPATPITAWMHHLSIVFRSSVDIICI
jgi:hypothetical protein